MSEEEKAEDAEEALVPAPAKSSKLVPLLLVVNTLLMGGVMAMVVLKKPAPGPAAAAGEGKEGGEHGEEKGGGEHGEEKGGGGEHKSSGPEPPGTAPGPMLKLENFIIQLKTADTERYVRVAFDLELTAELDKDPVMARMSQIRDAIISYFSDRSLDELRGSSGMERTKEQLAKRLDELVPGRRIKGMYITDFIVQ